MLHFNNKRGKYIIFSSKIKVEAANIMTTYKMCHKNNY